MTTAIRTNSSNDLLEEGTAAMELFASSDEAKSGSRERFDVIVIGAGQAGLSVGYYLAKTGLRFAILDANERIGDTWRRRWDSLRLFTPAKFDCLPGLQFPAPANAFPTKDEMAAYLEMYAARFRLPVRTGMRVERLYKRGTRYVVQAGGVNLEAAQVVVAMANYQRPRVPAFADGLSTDIVQMHSSEYRNLNQLKPGAVLIAGAGNSGAEIAMESARGGHRTWVAGKDVGQVPFRPERFFGLNLFGPLLLRVVFHRLLTVRTPVGRKARPKMMGKHTPLIRVKAKDLTAVSVLRVPRVTGVQDGRPLLEDGRIADVANVIWCSGFHPGFDWIDLPIFDERGDVRHQWGLVESQPGLYFVGLHFLFAMSSSMIHGVSRDAERIVRSIEAGLGRVSAASGTFATAPAGETVR